MWRDWSLLLSHGCQEKTEYACRGVPALRFDQESGRQQRQGWVWAQCAALFSSQVSAHGPLGLGLEVRRPGRRKGGGQRAWWSRGSESVLPRGCPPSAALPRPVRAAVVFFLKALFLSQLKYGLLLLDLSSSSHVISSVVQSAIRVIQWIFHFRLCFSVLHFPLNSHHYRSHPVENLPLHTHVFRLKSLFCNSNICVISGSVLLTAFSFFFSGYIFLLLCISSNFLLCAGHCESYIVEDLGHYVL